MAIETTFGGWLRQQRRQLDWTQAALAQRVGYSVATIRKLERDELRPSKHLAELLAQALEVATTQHEDLVNFARSTPTPLLQPDSQPLDEPRRSNLPAQLTPFFGRTAEIVELTQSLNNPATRLITIVGPGGMGKTRLALEVAQSIDDLRAQRAPAIDENTDQTGNPVNRQSKIVNRSTAAHERPKFPDGVYFVALAPLRAAEHIVPAIAEAITLRFQAGNRPPKEQLLDYLRHKELLLVLDNFEHLQAGSELILALLHACPGLHLLVTAREHLQLHSETRLVLESMALPPIATLPDVLSYSAVQLFVETACRLRPKFTLTAANAGAILQICQLVGGMPLGIILAAAWVEVLSPAEIVTELSQGFDFLAAELRDLPERQRSMRAVLTQSWQRLSDDERAVFMRLAVFRGGFTRPAAQSVAGASLRMISSLVNKSLVQGEPGGRYTIHELLRLFALEKLQECGAEGDLCKRHAEYYLDLTAALAASLQVQQQTEWLRRLDADLDNLRAAFQWFMSQQPAQAFALAGTLKDFWALRGYYQEGRQWWHQALAAHGAPASQSVLRLTTLEAIADLYFLQDEQWQEERVQAITDYQEALALWPQTPRDKLTKVRLLRKLGETVYARQVGAKVEPYRQPAHAALQEGLRLMADEPPHVETVLLLVGLSQQCWREREIEDWDAAEQYAQRAVDMAEQLNAPSTLSAALNALSVVYVARGRFRERAQVGLRRVELSHLSDFTDPYERVRLLREVGSALIDIGDYERALVYLQDAEELADQTHAVGVLGGLLHLQATCALRLDRWDDVAQADKLQSLQQRHPALHLTSNCFHMAMIACMHAGRGEKEQAATWRDASFDAMVNAIPPAQWKRTRHY